MYSPRSVISYQSQIMNKKNIPFGLNSGHSLKMFNYAWSVTMGCSDKSTLLV